MKVLHPSPSSSTAPVPHHSNGHSNPQHHQSRQQLEQENLYSTPSMERKKMITRREQEDLDKLLKDMIEELETFPEYSTYNPRTGPVNHNNNSRFQRNTSQSRSFSHSPSIRTVQHVPAVVSYHSATGQSCRSTPVSASAEAPDYSPSTVNFNQSHHPLATSSQFPKQPQQQVTTQAVVHNHPHLAPSTITSASSVQGNSNRSSSPLKGAGVTSTGQPYTNLYGSRIVQPGQVEYTYGQVKPPPPLQLRYQEPTSASSHHRHHALYDTTITGHNDENDFIGYTRSTPCSGQGSVPLPVMPMAAPYVTKQHDVPSYSPALSRSSAKSVTLPKPVTLASSDPTSRSISADRIRSTRVIPGAKIDLEDHDRTGVYASVLGKKSLSRSEREELDELVNVMMEEVRNFPDYPANISKRGTPFRRSVSHGSGVSKQTAGGHVGIGSRLSRMESRSPTRSFNQGSSLNRFNDRSTSWNRGMLRDSQSPGRCSRVLEQGAHGHGHSHGAGVHCGIANGGIVKPVEPLPPHLLTRPTQWVEDEVAGGHRLDRTPYHARADSRPFTYGVTPATAYPVLQRRRQNTESTAYIVENNPRPEQFSTFRSHGPPGDGSASRSTNFTSGPNIQYTGNLPGQSTYSVPRGSNYQQQYTQNYGSSSNEPLYNEQQSQTGNTPKIATAANSFGAGNENEVFSEASYTSSALDSSLFGGDEQFNNNLSWLQRQQNKLKVRRSSLDSHDRQVREKMFSELVGTVSGRKVPAINDSSRESSPPYQQLTSPVSLTAKSPDRRQLERQRTPSPPRSMVTRVNRNRSPMRVSAINVVEELPEEQTKPKVNYSSGPTMRSPLQRQKSDSSFDRYASRPMVVVSNDDSKEGNVPRSPSIPLYATVNRSGNETKPYDKYENRMNSFMSPPAVSAASPESNLVRHSSTGLLLRPGPPTTHEPPSSPTSKSSPVKSPTVTISPTYDRPKSPLSPVLVRPGSKSPRSRSPVRVEFKLDHS